MDSGRDSNSQWDRHCSFQRHIYGAKNQVRFEGECNSCGIDNHHTASYHFLLKLHQVLTLLGIDPDVGATKNAKFKEPHSYAQNRDVVRSFQASGSSLTLKRMRKILSTWSTMATRSSRFSLIFYPLNLSAYREIRRWTTHVTLQH